MFVLPREMHCWHPYQKESTLSTFGRCFQTDMASPCFSTAAIIKE